jgi:predicted anti-sigma-YlaC factor YlaD
VNTSSFEELEYIVAKTERRQLHGRLLRSALTCIAMMECTRIVASWWKHAATGSLIIELSRLAIEFTLKGIN